MEKKIFIIFVDVFKVYFQRNFSFVHFVFLCTSSKQGSYIQIILIKVTQTNFKYIFTYNYKIKT